MNRAELEHIIRAAGEVADVREMIILGSQSVLGQFPHIGVPLPESDRVDLSLKIRSCEILHRSNEADIMIPDSEEKTELIEAVIGELSSFHNTFGYYAQGVDYSTSTLPEGWENRLIEICNENTNGVTGLCLEIHDLMISKLYAGREKDIEFFHAAVNLELMSEETLTRRLNRTPISDECKRVIRKRMERGFSK